MRWLLWLSLAVVVLGCPPSDDHDHDHGHDHDEHEHAPEADDHGASDAVGITRWADDYELFAELAREPRGLAVHAHVTKLSDFSPVTDGRLVMQLSQDGAAVAELASEAPARPGIFTPAGPKLTDGTYTVTVRYERDGATTTFTGSPVVFGGRQAQVGRPTLSFLKEQQWVVPFRTAEAAMRPIAREVELPAIVEPAGTDKLTVSAPTSGRFFHNPKIKLAEGLHIEAGTLVGRIAPTVAGDDFSRLNLAVEEARIAKEQAERERARIEPMVKDGLLPQSRLIEVNNEIEKQAAKLRSARRRLGSVVAPGGKGGLVVKAALGGVVTEILVANGEPVDPGESLLRIGGERTRWVRARFVARPDEPLFDARAVAVRTASGARVQLEGRARLLSSHPTVDPKTQLATFIAEVGVDDHAESTHHLRSGSHVVLLLQVGERRERLAVPVTAVVDINTRRYVFVQVDGETFEKRRVKLGDRDGDFVEIVEGIADGERVVTTGGYDVHLASILGAVESHQH
jgi:membrane fusion protein, heavy metal efflux system